jgi:hypothetical protein
MPHRLNDLPRNRRRTRANTATINTRKDKITPSGPSNYGGCLYPLWDTGLGVVPVHRSVRPPSRKDYWTYVPDALRVRNGRGGSGGPPGTPISPECLEKLSKKSGRPQNEGVRSLRNGAKGLISLRYAGDFCARDTTERLFRQFQKVNSANFALTAFWEVRYDLGDAPGRTILVPCLPRRAGRGSEPRLVESGHPRGAGS